MQFADLSGVRIHFDERGPANGPALVFINALGTDFRIWDDVVARLSPVLRVIRFDLRGHGLSACPEGPYYMGDLVAETGRLLDHLNVRESVVVGCSLGGAIAQGLAAERLELVRAMVLSNTAAKFGIPAKWNDRIAAVRAGGIEAIADATMDNWFARKTRTARPDLVAGVRAMLTRQPIEGYIACCEAIAETDLYDSTARLRLPTLGIAGSEDGSTPPDLVQETTALVRGSRFHLIRQAGHLCCLEKPDEYAEVLTGFLQDIGHI